MPKILVTIIIVLIVLAIGTVIYIKTTAPPVEQPTGPLLEIKCAGDDDCEFKGGCYCGCHAKNYKDEKRESMFCTCETTTGSWPECECVNNECVGINNESPIISNGKLSNIEDKYCETKVSEDMKVYYQDYFDLTIKPGPDEYKCKSTQQNAIITNCWQTGGEKCPEEIEGCGPRTRDVMVCGEEYFVEDFDPAFGPSMFGPYVLDN